MVESFSIDSASVSDRGLSEKRPQNEDSFLEIPSRGIFAVADGVGGAEAGEVASQMAMEILGEAFTNFADGSDAEVVMNLALGRANAAIHQMANDLSQLSRMATTVVALHLSGNIATIGHVGDSRLYRLDATGTLHRETADHSMVAEEVRAGRMTEEQAENHPGKNIISRALGAEPDVEVELKTIMVGAENTFLICSDGVTRHIPDAEITELLSSNEDPDSICQRIKDICFSRGAEDNLTAVIVRLSGAGQQTTAHAPSSDVGNVDEITVASVRPQTELRSANPFDDDDVLELDTMDLSLPEAQDVLGLEQPVRHAAPVAATSIDKKIDVPSASANPFNQQPGDADDGDYETSASIPVEYKEEHIKVAQEPAATSAPEEDIVPTYGKASEAADERKESGGGFGKLVAGVGLLLLGAIVGLLSYHFLLANRSQPTPLPLPEKTSPEDRSRFEVDLRSVDTNPDEARAKHSVDPRDAMDYYLVGRANLLLGNYAEARKNFEESRKKITAGQVDKDTAKTLETEIAIAIVLTNDPPGQGLLKKELDAMRSPTAPAKPANANK